VDTGGVVQAVRKMISENSRDFMGLFYRDIF